MTVRTLKALTPARMKKKLRTPVLKLRCRDLHRPEVMPPSLLLDPALQKPMSPLR
jgi:hypothetical protein